MEDEKQEALPVYPSPIQLVAHAIAFNIFLGLGSWLKINVLLGRGGI